MTPDGNDEGDQLLMDVTRLRHRQEGVIHAQRFMLLGLYSDGSVAEPDDRVGIRGIIRSHLKPRRPLRRERDLAGAHDPDAVLDLASVIHDLDLRLGEHRIEIQSARGRNHSIRKILPE